MSIHTLSPGVRLPGFFTRTNVEFISNKVTKILGKEYSQRIIIPNNYIVREMQFQHEDRLETIAKMNHRVVIELVKSFRNYQSEIEKSNYYSRNVWNSYNYDSALGIKPYETPKLNNNARGFRFHFIF